MTGKKDKKKTADALDILHRRHYKGRPERLAALEHERLNAEIAHALYRLRTSAGMTQKELAEKIGTRASAISRLENADYGGHSLAVLNKIAAVFKGRLTLSIIPAQSSRSYLMSPSGEKISKEHVLA
ncbi:MAG: helix-turn-helix transcriptional regulator [Candidatus Zixiibacteriota bacterium]|jgi:DNA-binding XRE family transcriptional regulator